MTLTQLYQAAIEDQKINSTYYGTGRFTLKDGSEIFCCIDKVAGRSVRIGHFRTTYRLRLVNEKYSKRISHKQAVEMMK